MKDWKRFNWFFPLQQEQSRTLLTAVCGFLCLLVCVIVLELDNNPCSHILAVMF